MAHAQKVLVVYGVPPNHIQLFSAGGKRLHKDWKFDAKTFGGAQQKNFEAKLRDALQTFMAGEVADIGRADYAFVADAGSLAQVLRRGAYTHVVYYGHAVDDGATLKPLKEITVKQMADALSGANVVHIDILGCSSASFAAKLVLSVPKLTAGSFLTKRLDDIEVDMATMQLKKLVIERQPLHHFRPSQP